MCYKCMISLNCYCENLNFIKQRQEKGQIFCKKADDFFFVFIVARLIGLLSRFVFLRHCCGPCCGPYCGHC